MRRKSLVTAPKIQPPKDVQNQFLASVRKGQEAVIDGINVWVDTVKSAAAELPAVTGLDKLPKPEEVVRNAYDLAEKVLAGQREFAEKVVATSTELRPRI
jgi:hypothetical protein